MRHALFIPALLLGLSSSVSAYAQSPKAPQSKSPGPALRAEPLEMSEIDGALAHISEIMARYSSQADREAGPWSAKLDGLISGVLKKNPEYTWHYATGPGDKSGFVLKSSNPAAEPKK